MTDRLETLWSSLCGVFAPSYFSITNVYVATEKRVFFCYVGLQESRQNGTGIIIETGKDSI